MTKKIWLCVAFFVLVISILWSGCGGGSGGSGGPGGSSPPDTGFPSEPVANVEIFMDGLSFPVSMAFAPDGRLFFNELQTGKIRLIQDGILQIEPLATLTVSTSSEQGLLGIVLDPGFAANGFLYVYYTDPNPLRNRVVRFTVQGSRATNQTTILDSLPVGTIHNGGNLAFGPDGMLYVSIGDTGDENTAQNTALPAGKILRVDPSGSIPPDNPFEQSYAYAIGLRNPFDLTFHPILRKLWATENGPVGNDEINRMVRGGNYGWPIVQGTAGNPDFIDPALVFNPAIAPTGITFYTGSQFPSGFQNNLFFVSFLDGSLHRVMLDNSLETLVAHEVFATELGSLLDIVQGPDGALYLSNTTSILKVTVVIPL